jgi:hypothetical protein
MWTTPIEVHYTLYCCLTCTVPQTNVDISFASAASTRQSEYIYLTRTFFRSKRLAPQHVHPSSCSKRTLPVLRYCPCYSLVSIVVKEQFVPVTGIRRYKELLTEKLLRQQKYDKETVAFPSPTLINKYQVSVCTVQ